MDPLDFLTEEELLRFFHCKKTEMSCIEPHHTFLNQLRDYNLIPEDRYKKVIRAKSKPQKEKGLYQVLDWLETERPQCIKLFWRCLFKDHMLQMYPAIRLLKNSLLDGSFHFSEELPEKKETSEESKKEEKKKTDGKKSIKKRGAKKKDNVEEQEEEEEEEEEEPGPSTKTTPSKKKRPEKPSYCSPIRKGVKEDIWKWPFYKTHLPVTCGDKEGSLYRDKLAKGEECILSDGRWFAPPDFEKFGGKERCKNWKTSIRCQNTTLLELIQKGELEAPRFRSRRSRESDQGSDSESSSDWWSPVRNLRKRRTSANSRQLTHEISDSDFEDDEEEEEDDEENSEEGVENSDDQEAVANGDTSEFPGPFLSVICGSASGDLLKDRFASGNSGKCIRMASKWVTPVQFAKEDPAMANSYWKKSILCQGVPLSDLIKRRVLLPHSLLCKCKLCSTKKKDQEEQENDDHCSVCSQRGSLLCCDRCPRAFHSACHLPAVEESMLGQTWLCTFCVLASNQWMFAAERSRQQALDSPTSDFMLQCQYLLLRLYSSDEDRIFSGNPCGAVPRYREFIQNPMWLDKVAEKLQKRQYSKVGQYVSDIQLIFKNSATFNRDNAFGQKGARLKQLFEMEFEQVFSVRN